MCVCTRGSREKLVPLAEQKVSKKGVVFCRRRGVHCLGWGIIYSAEPFLFSPSDVSNSVMSHVSSKDSCSPAERLNGASQPQGGVSLLQSSDRRIECSSLMDTSFHFISQFYVQSLNKRHNIQAQVTSHSHTAVQDYQHCS